MSIIRDDSNLSFTKLYEQLTAEGIKNIDHLVNIKSELYGKDPYDKNIDSDTKRAIIFNVIDDFWYFIRNVVRIPIIEDPGFSSCKINESNFTSLNSVLNGLNVYSNNPRMTLTTMTACAYYLWKIVRTNVIRSLGEHEPYELTILTIRGEDHKLMKERIKHINSLLPEYLRVNSELIDDVINPYVNLSNVATAEQFARGLKGDVFINEFDFIYNIDVVMQHISIIKYVDWGRIQVWATSSVGEDGSKSKLAADKLVMRSTKWHSEFFNLGLDFIKNEFIYINIPYKRLVENPEEWFDTMTKMLNHDEGSISREVLMTR